MDGPDRSASDGTGKGSLVECMNGPGPFCRHLAGGIPRTSLMIAARSLSRVVNRQAIKLQPRTHRL